MNKKFYHQTVTTKQIESYLSKETGIDLSEFFEQYLRTTKIPTLEYKLEGKLLKYRYTEIIDGFDMPIKINLNSDEKWLYPTSEWKTFEDAVSKESEININRNFYVNRKSLE